MNNSLIVRLLKRLEGSRVVLKSDKVEHSYSANRDSLASLISDHPQFLVQISNSRKAYGLPSEGYLKESDALNWEISNQKSRAELIKEIEDFISSFEFNSIYRGDIQAYCYEAIVCPPRSNKWSKSNAPSLVIVDTDEDKQVNAHLISSNSRYIQIFDWTTLEDVEKNWHKIQDSKKQKNSEQQGNQLRKIIWHLKTSGLNYKEIYRELKNHHSHLYQNLPGKVFDESYIGIYAKRYEASLKRLKDF
jgi:hypothetical protein